MKCGIVEVQFRPYGTCSTPAMQDLGKWFDCFFTEIATFELFPEWEPMDEDNAVDAQEHCEHAFMGCPRMHDSCRNLIGPKKHIY
jgi:hypothetical protein